MFSQIVHVEPAAFENSADATIRGVVAENDTVIVISESSGQEVAALLEFEVVVPEVRDLVAHAHPLIDDAERDIVSSIGDTDHVFENRTRESAVRCYDARFR